MKKTKLNKLEKYYLSLYEKSEMMSLKDLYKSCSSDKEDAEWRIRYFMREDYQGYSYRVLGGNSFYFTCAYKYKATDKDTGEVIEYLKVFTGRNVYHINLSLNR